MLYELLVGQTPFDARELLQSGVDAMRRTLREKEPIRPSTRLGGMTGEQRTSTARRRGADAAKLIGLLKGDLDWIVLKCLEKDRTRRYETANGLALDVRRFLDLEPISARAPGRFYRLQKMARRNKLAFVAVGAVFASLVIGIAVSTWLFFGERRAKQIAVAAEREQNRLRQVAESAQENESIQRRTAQKMERGGAKAGVCGGYESRAAGG